MHKGTGWRRLACGLAVLAWLPSQALADGCASDADCKADRRCIEGECRTPEPTCRNDQDCPDDQVCERRQCVLPARTPEQQQQQQGVEPRATNDLNMAWEVVAGGGLQAQTGGVGLGWQASVAWGVRLDAGVALLALGSYGRASSTICDDGTTACTNPPVLHLATYGLGVRYLSQRRGATTTGLVRVTEPFTPGGDTGWGLSTRYHHTLVPGWVLTVDSLVGVMTDGMAYTLGIGIGWTD